MGLLLGPSLHPEEKRVLAAQVLWFPRARPLPALSPSASCPALVRGAPAPEQPAGQLLAPERAQQRSGCSCAQPARGLPFRDQPLSLSLT